MPKHDQHPTSPEDDTYAHQEIIQFNDGELALGFREPGDRVPLGHGSDHKYARDLDLDGMAIIKTKSGNVYGIADGLVINQGTQRAYLLPEDTIQVTIGEPCTIEGVGTTSDVESVVLRYKIDGPGSEMADHQVDKPSPFKALEAQVRAVDSARLRT